MKKNIYIRLCNIVSDTYLLTCPKISRKQKLSAISSPTIKHIICISPIKKGNSPLSIPIH